MSLAACSLLGPSMPTMQCFQVARSIRSPILGWLLTFSSRFLRVFAAWSIDESSAHDYFGPLSQSLPPLQRPSPAPVSPAVPPIGHPLITKKQRLLDFHLESVLSTDSWHSSASASHFARSYSAQPHNMASARAARPHRERHASTHRLRVYLLRFTRHASSAIAAATFTWHHLCMAPTMRMAAPSLDLFFKDCPFLQHGHCGI